MAEFLRFYGEERVTADLPRRLYARIDRTAPYGPGARSSLAGDEVALLDSVDANWFDETRRERPGPLADASTVDDADHNVSVVAVRKHDLDAMAGEQREEEAGWLEVALTPDDEGEPLALHYPNLFAAPVRRTLLGASWVDEDLDRELADKTSMDDLPDADPADLYALLGGMPEPDAVAVYDVGQGNCTAALTGGVPCLYFDFGGGVMGNRKTFPAALKRFCFTRSPPIVLSHWDWDHWSSANRDPNAYGVSWILPRQGGGKGLGAVHRTFLGRLLQNGVARVWPATLPSLRVGSFELLKCRGPARSRNDSGLALVIEHTAQDGTRERMLLPGDCAYRHVPDADTWQFVSLVAAHHGGRTGGKLIPNPAGHTAGRLVYTHGWDNTYGHPFDAVRDEHVVAGWVPALETPSRCPPRAGPGAVLGHVHLYWDTADPDAHPACGATHCDLTCHQR